MRTPCMPLAAARYQTESSITEAVQGATSSRTTNPTTSTVLTRRVTRVLEFLEAAARTRHRTGVDPAGARTSAKSVIENAPQRKFFNATEPSGRAVLVGSECPLL